NNEPYNVVWRRRVFSNALSALTLVPSLVLALPNGLGWIRRASRRHLAGFSVLAGGLVLVAWGVFTAHDGEPVLWPGGPSPALPLLLPLLMVAAGRFGPGGPSFSLLATALFAIAPSLSGWTPLRAIPAEERVLALQVFLIVVGVPLLVLSGLTE